MTLEDIRKLPLTLRPGEVQRITGLGRNKIAEVAKDRGWFALGTTNDRRYRTSDVLRWCGYDPDTGRPEVVRLG